MAEYWNLKEGIYRTEQVEEEQIQGIVKKVVVGKISRTTDYKYAFMKALLECLDKVDANYKVSFYQLFSIFTESYYTKYLSYTECKYEEGIKEIASEIKSELVQNIHFMQGEAFESLNDKEKLIKNVQEIGKKYVIGAFYGDTEELFYSFSIKEGWIIFNPSVYEVLKNYREMIERANDYEWTRWIEKGIVTKKQDSWSKPTQIKGLIGRKRVDNSLINSGVTGIPKEFCLDFKIMEEINNEWEEQKRVKREVSIIFKGIQYKGEVYRRTTGTSALDIKSRELREIATNVFIRSAKYIVPLLEPGKKKEIIVPDEFAEYLEVYEMNRMDCFEVKLCTNNLEEWHVGGAENLIGYNTLGNDRKEEVKSMKLYKEDELIQQIHTYITSKGFSYSIQTIQNLYLSLKTKPFTILAGVSGTGKSKIIELFAEAIGATVENGCFKLIAVRPDWSDSTELLGYRDLNNHFNPGMLTELIVEASNNLDKPYFVCLDEMNLARVEYYLSDFLSIIESRKWNGDKIVTHPLLHEGAVGEDEVARKRYGALYIPENVYIVGTVNMDETTYPFSKKVLDRANTIEFLEVNLLDGLEELEEEVVSSLEDVDNRYMKSMYLNLMDCKAHKEVAKKVVGELVEVNKILELCQIHFAYRVRDEIVFYMLYNDQFELMSYEEAFELQLLQKILPRITGSSGKVLQVLQGLQEYTEQRYPKAYQKIQFMIERYEEDGFTSYWM